MTVLARRLHKDSPPEPERAELERQIESLRRDIRHLQLEQGGADKILDYF